MTEVQKSLPKWILIVAGPHKGKDGIVRDTNTSKTGHITITVVQNSGVRFKTLDKNAVINKA